MSEDRQPFPRLPIWPPRGTCAGYGHSLSPAQQPAKGIILNGLPVHWFFVVSAVAAIVVGTFILTLGFRRLVAAGRGWVVAICAVLGAYLGLGSYLAGPICGFNFIEHSAVGTYQEVCTQILTPAFVVMFISTAFFPLFLIFMALTIGSVLALPCLLAIRAWKWMRA